MLLFGLFLALLTGGRLLWHETFKPAGQPHAAGGVLDLRGTGTEPGRTVTLDGEWEFYQGMFLLSGGGAADVPAGEEHGPRIVRVPGTWNGAMRPGEPTPYGYGTYRLRILLDPGDPRTYGIYVPSVRSSSRLFVDGKLLHAFGHPAPDADGHEAANAPFTAAFAAGESGIVEVVVETANYADPRGGGLVARSGSA